MINKYQAFKAFNIFRIPARMSIQAFLNEFE